ncbi:MAG TPA: PAS-domain containing protein, partial [Nevskiaceae bacterium]|nr:PAS-domain containing protein [Nevskiaceae bacterium]
GMVAGFALWFYTLLLPAVLSGDAAPAWFVSGPWGWAWLRPQALLGTAAWPALAHGTFFSLAANMFCYVAGSIVRGARLHDRLQLVRFLGDDARPPAAARKAAQVEATVGDLQELLERFLGAERTRDVLSGHALRADARADAALLRQTEHLLAGALGASSARLVLSSMLRGRDMQLEEVIGLLDETSHAIQFNRELLRATLEHLSQGVSVVDAELRLVAWNRRYVELLGYPEALVTVGRPIEELVRYNAQRGLLGSGDTDEQVRRRLEHMRAGHAYTHQRGLPDGSVVEIRGNPMPGGGFVTSYSDVTDYKRSERALQEAKESLETRVDQRTRELAQAKLAAEHADDAKTRFLAAASHDLVQPLNAARLFISSIDRARLDTASAGLVGQVENSLGAAEELLAGLLDISRLDAHAQEVRREHFRLSEVLAPLAAETALLAARHGLKFRYAGCERVVHSDPRLLRRIVQNFLSNAVRYTVSGRILLGCRRAPGGAVRIEVWDTGPGIAPERQREIFEEFRRLEVRDAHGQRGLGLGLAIVERIARLLDHPLGLRSQPGRGSVFSVTVPRGIATARAAPARRSSQPRGRVAGARVLC